MSTVKLRYTGSAAVRRIIGDVEWSSENGHVSDAPVELAADLLTSREASEWELAEEPEPATARELTEAMGGVWQEPPPVKKTKTVR